MTDGCMGCRVPGYSHAAYCPEGRVEDLRSRLADYELLKRAVNETGDCLPDCDSYAHNEQCPNVNNHVVLQDKQREIESLRSRLDELREAAGKVTCATCDGEGKLDDGEWMPCPDCGDLRRLLGEKP